MIPRTWAIAVAVLAGGAACAVWSGVLVAMTHPEQSTVCTVPNPPAITPGVPVVNR
jgi:hypothetical protein